MTQTKICPKCLIAKELTEENFYVARPREGHNKVGWQSGCKDCWKQINKANKKRIRNASAC